MLIDSDIKIRVLEIHRGRNKNIWFYHLLLLLPSLWSFWQNIFESSLWLSSVIITGIAILIHGLIMSQKIYANRVSEKLWPVFFEYFSIGLLAFGWSLFLWSIKSVIGLESP